MVKTGSEALLSWAQLKTKGYQDVNIQNFTTSWQDGLAFCALIHKFHPKLIAFPLLKKRDKDKNLELAFSRGAEVGIPRLITKEDIEQSNEVSIMQYVARYYFILEVKEKDHARKHVESIYLEEESDRPKKSVKVAALGAKIKLNPAMMNPAAAAQIQQEKEKAKEEEKANEEPSKLQHLTASRAAPPKRKPPAKARGKPQQQRKTIGPAEPRASQSEDLDDTEDSQSYSFLFSKATKQPAENTGQNQLEKQQVETTPPQPTETQATPSNQQVETTPQQETETQETPKPAEQKPRTETVGRPKPVPPPKPTHLTEDNTNKNETSQQQSETQQPTTTPTQQTDTQELQKPAETSSQQVETAPQQPTETRATPLKETANASSSSDLSFLMDDLKARKASRTAQHVPESQVETQQPTEKPAEPVTQQTATVPQHTETQDKKSVEPASQQPAQKPTETTTQQSATTPKRTVTQSAPLQRSKSAESTVLGVFIAIPAISFSQLMKIDCSMNTGDLKDLLTKQYAERVTDIHFFDLAIMSNQDDALWLNYDVSVQENKITESSTVVFVDKREFADPEPEEKPKEAPPPDAVEGFLIKEVKTTLKSSRKRRWFISQENRLCYYKDKKDPDPIGVINLTKDTEVVKVGTATFLIKTPTRAFQLVANSADDMNLWINGLNTIISYYTNKSTSTFKEGYLQKSDPKGNNWKNRLFVLRQDFLYYYEVSEKGLYHKGKCPLYQGKVETSKLSNKERKWVFQLATKERTFFMAAPTQEERNEWMEAIQKRIEQVNKSIDSITIE